MLPKSKSLFARMVHILPSRMTLILVAIIVTSVISSRSAALAAENAAPTNSAPQSSSSHTATSLLSPAFTVTKQDALLVDNDSDTQADPGDTIGYTVVITNTGPDPATGVVFTDTIDASTTLIAGSVETTPLARNDSYTALGNVRISHPAAAGLLVNDNDPDGGAVTITSFDPVSVQGGAVVVNLDGSFNYNPPAGYEGVDTFTYTITDDEGDTDTGIVTITTSGMIWFINNNPAACSSDCDGRLTNPFTSLGAFQAVNDGTGNNPATGDNIFLYESAANYTGPVTLLSNQRLIGQDATAPLTALSGLTPPAGSDPLPAMNSGNGVFATITSSSTGVTLGQNNSLHGFTAGNATGTAVTGTNFGTLVVSDVTINTTGSALNLSTGSFGTPATFTSITATGGANNVNLNGVGGTGNLGTGALSGATNHAFVMTGGTGIISYGGTINNTTARVVSITGKTGGSVTLSGAVTSTSQGVFLDNNGGAAISFTGGNMNLNTGANNAFTATGGGTVNVTGTGNVLNTTTGTALLVTSTNIGASNLNFQSIASNGGATPGINLNTTGAAGGLIVTGTGGAGTGGTIQNKSVDAVQLTSTANVNLSSMNITNNTESGIFGTTVTGLTMNGLNITNNGNDGADEGVRINNLFGTSTFTNVTITGSAHNNLWITNNSGTLTSLTITGGSFSNNSVTLGNNGILFEAIQTAVVNSVTITGATISTNRATGLGVFVVDSGLISAFRVQTSTFTNNNIAMDFSGVDGVSLTGASMNFSILNNTTITGHNSHAINVNMAVPSSGLIQGFVQGNVIGNAAVVGSGSAIGSGIRVVGNSNGDLNLLFDANMIRQTPNGRGIDIQGRNGTGQMDVTITNNTVNPDDTSGFPLAAIFVHANVAGTAGYTVRSDVRGNNVPAGGTFDLLPTFIALVETAGANKELVDVPPASANCTAQVAGANTGSASASGTCALIAGPINVPPMALWEENLDDPEGNEIPVEQPDETEEGSTIMPLTENNTISPTTPTLVETSNISTTEAELSVAPTAAPMLSGENVNIVIGVLPPGKSITVRFNVTVDTPFPAGSSQVCNQSTILSNELSPVVSDDPDTGPVDDPTCTPIDAAPDLSIVKSDGGISSVPDGVITYTLTYSNTGNQHANGVTLSDTVPVGTTFNPAASTAGWSCVPNNSAGSVCTLNVGDVNVGTAVASATFAVTVNNPVPAGLDAVSNTAAIADDGTGGADPTPANNSSTDTTPITANPDLTLSKDDGGATGTPGGVVAYTLTYTNTGNQGAANVTLTDTVPANSTFNPGASTAGWSCVPDNSAGSVCTLNVGTVNGGNAGGSVTFAATIINPVPAGVNQISNTAAIADDGANGADPTPGNNSDSDTTPINAAPDMSITKSDGGVTTTPGGTVAYTLSYANTGNQGATGVTLSETVPANSTFNAGVSTAGWVCVPDNNAGSTCTLDIGAVAGGGGSGSATFAVTVVNPVPAGVTQISNTATVADDGTNGADPTPGNNSGSDTTPVTATPDLTISKDDGGVTGTPGGVVAYTLTYTNTGNQGATGVTLTDVVPANTVFNPGASTAGWACAPDNNAGSTCTLTVGTLAGGGATGSATFAVTVINPVPAGVTQISNTASIADDGANGADPTPGNNSSSDTTPINAAPDMQIAKSDGDIAFLPGDFITYTLTYQNVGNQDATGVALTDTVPANTTFIPAASSAGWSCAPDNSAGSLCTLSIGAVNGGGGGTAVFTVQVDDPAPGVTLITNTAGVADDGSNGADPNPTDNTDTDTTPIANLPPTLTNVVITSPLNENGVATLSGDISDPDVADAFTLTVDWGDGSAPDIYNYPAGTTSFSETHQYLDDNPTGTPSDNNTVSLSLSDGTNVVNASTAVTVNNIAPTLSGVSATNVNENGTATLSGSITDPGTQDTFTLLVNWGDGNSDTYNYPAGTTNFSETHQYLDDNPSGTPTDDYTISLTLTDDDTGSATDSVTTTISNVAPTLSNVAVTANVDEGGSATLSGLITDPGTLDTFALVVDWGDGNSDTYNYPAGATSFSETHTYADDDPTGTPSDIVTISLTLTDDDTGSDSETASLTVHNIAPDLFNLAATPLIISETNSLTLTGSIADPGVLDTFALVVDWADGNVETVNYPAGTTAFTLTHTYDDDALLALHAPEADFTIDATLMDDDTGSDSDSVTVTVENLPPTLSGVTISSPVNEGSAATLAGSISDPSPADTFTLLVDWGDGITETFSYGAGATGFSETHVYVDDDPAGTPSDIYTVTLTLTDDNGGSDTGSLTVTVNNVAPQLGSVAATAVSENDFTTLSGSITDPGTADTFTLVVDWGDGITETFSYGAGTASFSETHQYLDDDPSSTPADDYTISLMLTDDDTGSDAGSTTVTVSNVAPALNNLTATDVAENGVSVLSGDIADPGTLDTFTVVVDWGDGSTPETFNYAAGTTSFSETHQYLDDDPSGTPADEYTVTVTVTDDDTGVGNGTAVLTVSNVAPDLFNVAATPLNIDENNTITVTGQISDVGTLDSFTLEVDWADGITETFSYPAGTSSFLVTHLYEDDALQLLSAPLADFDIVLTLTDDDTGSDSETITVQVDNVAPALDNVSISDPINEGDTATLNGSIIEVSPADSFTLTVAWGDGAVDSYAYGAGTTDFSENHTYADDNPTGTPSDVYTVTLTLVDDNGGTAVHMTTLTVYNVAPVVDAGADMAVNTGTAVTFNGSFSDIGIEDTHTIEWDLGDGHSTSGTLTPTHTYGAAGVYTATLTVTDDDTGVTTDQVVVTVSGSTIFLPIIVKDSSAATGPDLVVSSLTAVGNSITVVVTNQGNTAVTDDFWVDVYIDPDPVPTMVNQTWQLVADHGLVWGVSNVILNPGQSLTLTINGAHYRADLSDFAGPLAVGTPVYAQVDSANTATTYGNVLESHESSGGVYNNITGTTAQ
ncbi:MAG: DUF11 domain-containing protein [Anaerolineae bacterium]|nr:DUF11 domain-containing protein [Anaerolineae bacterium]